MDRVRQASAVGNTVVRSYGSGNGGEAHEKRGSKHQVSLKNIAFEGSQRRLSVLHPSHNLSAKLPSVQAI